MFARILPRSVCVCVSDGMNIYIYSYVCEEDRAATERRPPVEHIAAPFVYDFACQYTLLDSTSAQVWPNVARVINDISTYEYSVCVM